MAGTLETTFGKLEGRETCNSASGEISDCRPGGQTHLGKLAGKSKLLGRATLKPGGGDNGVGAIGKGAVEDHIALLWYTRLTGAGDGAGEALCTSSLPFTALKVEASNG